MGKKKQKKKKKSRTPDLAPLIGEMRNNIGKNVHRGKKREAKKCCTEFTAKQIINNAIVGSGRDAEQKAGTPYDNSDNARRIQLIELAAQALLDGQPGGGIDLSLDSDGGILINGVSATKKGGEPITKVTQIPDDCWQDLDKLNQQQKEGRRTTAKEYSKVVGHIRQTYGIQEMPDIALDDRMQQAVSIWSLDIATTEKVEGILDLFSLQHCKSRLQWRKLEAGKKFEARNNVEAASQVSQQAGEGEEDDSSGDRKKRNSLAATDRLLEALRHDALLFGGAYATLFVPVLLTYGLAIGLAQQIFFFGIILPIFASWIGGAIGWKTPGLF